MDLDMIQITVYGRSPEKLFYHYSGIPVNIFGDFCHFLVSQWHFSCLVGVLTFLIIPAEQFGMQYLPPGGSGRSSESLFYHYSGEPANIFGDFW